MATPKGSSRTKHQWGVKNSNIPSRFFGLTPEDLGTTYPKEIEKYLETCLQGKVIKNWGGLGVTGVGLLLDGDPGLGKTSFAVMTLLEFIRRLPEEKDEAQKILHYTNGGYGLSSRPVYYMTFPDFIHRKKALIDADPAVKRNMQIEMDGFHGQADDDSMNVRLLVIDDLGKEVDTEYSHATVDELLRSRYDKALPTIVTTNVVREDWGKRWGDAMGSFVYEGFKRVIINKQDNRRA